MKPISEMSMKELAAYFYWDDRQALAQAVWVAQMNEMDFSEQELWAHQEKMMQKYRDFLQRIS